MSSPKVSFVIPSHNAAAWLAMAVESAQKQTYANLEICVIDDGSKDTTPILMRYLCDKDKRIIHSRNEKNMGASYCRNKGISEMATGDLIFVLDADDLAYHNRVRLSLDKLKKCDLVYGATDVIDELGNITGRNHADVFDPAKARETLLNHIVHSSMAYTKDLAATIPYSDGEVSMLGIDDWAFQTEAYHNGAKFDHIPTVIGAYRYHSSGISQGRDEKHVADVKREFLSGLGVRA